MARVVSDPVQPWRRVRLPWRIVGSLIAAFMLITGVAEMVGRLAERQEVVDEVVGARSVDRVRIELRDSEVEIVGADVESIAVTGTFTTGIRDNTLDVEVRDDRLHVALNCAGGFGVDSCGADLRIEVPRALAVQVDAPNSSIRLRDLDGLVEATSSNTDLSAVGLAGTVRLHSSNGSIEATALRSTDVTARTSNDDVRLEFLVAPTAVEVVSENGEAEIVLPDDDVFYDLQLRTSNAATLAEVRSDPDSDRRISVTTSNDDIVVRYPS